MSSTDGNDWKTDEKENIIFLDAAYDKIPHGGYIVISEPGKENDVHKIKSADIVPRSSYGISAKVTRLELYDDWFSGTITMDEIRQAAIHIQSDHLELAEEPVLNEEGDLMDISGETIELDGIYDGLQSGRWIIVSGERTDIPGTTGVLAAELAMVSGSEQKVNRGLPGDTVHTTLTFAKPLAYTYRRDTVTIYANVVKATHGETHTELLGSGDGSRWLQEFALRQFPLTYVSAPSAGGISSTLEVRVNSILWHEADCLAGLRPDDRKFITMTDDDGKTSVVFGDGIQGSRLPTGIENVKAEYRTGIGSAGNVKAGQITMLATKPLGVKGVVNPVRASGGADRETRDQARRNAPRITMSLDRLVSVRDYADFARTFAGIGKADARPITDGDRMIVHITIAGSDDIPIDPTSDLYQNLLLALQKHGDPYQPVDVAVRELQAILVSARVKLLADYAWDATEPRIRAALLDTFSFDRRELGQSVYLSEVVSVIQNVEGVGYVDITAFRGLTQDQLLEMMEENEETGDETEEEGTRSEPCRAIRVRLAEPDTSSTSTVREILPAQIAYLLPNVPDTLILNEVTE